MDRRVVLLLYDGMQPIDLLGPHESCSIANRVLDARRDTGPRYLLERVSPGGGAVCAESGMLLAGDTDLPTDTDPIDTLVVPGGDGSRDREVTEALAPWRAAAASRSRRVATVCSGAFLAAAAGLCGGRRVTTHWLVAEELARRYPDVQVDADPIYIRDGDLWSSAGVTAGIDLGLALVDDDCGPDVARWVARSLVVPLHR